MEPAKRAPAFQLYPQDFISSLDVQMMSAAEVGAYCLLLFNSWTQARQGYLPNDETQLHFMSRLTPDQWKQSKKKLLSKFPPTADKKFRFNPRLVSESEKHSAFRERQAENGKRGGRPRKDEPQAPAKPLLGETQNNPSLSQPLEVANPDESSSTSSSTSSSFSSSEDTSSLRSEDAATAAALPEKKIEAVDLPLESPDASASHTRGAADVPTRKPAPLHFPEWATSNFRDEWDKWVAYRQKKRDKLKPESLQKLLDKLGQFDEAYCSQLFDNAIANGYTGLVFNDTAQKFAQYLQTQQPGYENATNYRAQNVAPGHSFQRPTTVHANPFGFASPVSLAIAGALAVSSRDSNYGLEL